jgi:hypothetical protein
LALGWGCGAGQRREDAKGGACLGSGVGSDYRLDLCAVVQVFRYNNRATKDNPLTDASRFTLAVSQISDKRLTFAELIGKVPPS